MPLFFTSLPDRAVLRIAGKDARGFLQGLVTNDVTKATPERAIWAALLSPQGKFQADFFLVADGDDLLLDVERATLESLVKKLTAYRLRADARIAEEDAFRVHAFLGEESVGRAGLPSHPGALREIAPGAHLFVDPRAPTLGARFLATPEEAEKIAARWEAQRVDSSAYERLRLEHGVPEGSKDAVVDRTFLLENGYDLLGGVDFGKGCYVGQEVTARSRLRGGLPKALYSVAADAPLPSTRTPILAGDNAIGEMRSSAGTIGLAMLRSEEWRKAEAAGTELRGGGVILRASSPPWRKDAVA